jgi:beta-glucosidase
MKKDAKGRKTNPGVTSGICHTTPSPPAPACNANKVCVNYVDGTDAAAVATASKAADIVLVFVATTSHEGSDRSDLTLGSQDAMVASLAAVAGSKTAVVVVTPGAVLTPWREQVAAVLTPMMPGQEYGNAITDVLFGKVNPSGKLLVTFPKVDNEMQMTQAQWPGINNSLIAVYSEKLNVGYRWWVLL